MARALLRNLFAAPFHSILANRRLIAAFVRQDIRSRYVASVMGLSWTVIQPVALLVLYTFVFSSILRLRYADDGSTASFGAYLFCGLLPWFAFSESITRSASVVIANTNLIKRVIFPSDILPVYVVVSALLIELIGLAVFFLVLAVFYGGLSWYLPLLALVIGAQFLLTTGLSWIVASLNVFLRDVGQVLGLVLTSWLFLTPILYPEHLIPERYRFVLDFNPMFYVVDGYRDVIMDRQLPSVAGLAIAYAMALSLFLAGHWFFRRSRKAFVDVL